MASVAKKKSFYEVDTRSLTWLHAEYSMRTSHLSLKFSISYL